MKENETEWNATENYVKEYNSTRYGEKHIRNTFDKVGEEQEKKGK